MLKILHFIFGRLYFQVKGYQTERFFESLCKKSSCIVGIKTSIRRLCVFYQTKFLSNVGSISRESKC